MIVNIRVEVTDEQRNVFSRKLHPKAPKRLATRGEFNEAVAAFVAELVSEPSPAEKRDSGQELAAKQVRYVPFDDAPLVPVQCDAENDCSDSENIERHGTGIESDRTPISRALEAVNTAMLSLGRVRHHAESCGFTDSIGRLLDDICNVRAEMVDEYARQRFEREL